MPASTRENLLCRYHYDPLDRQVDCTPFKQAAIQRYYCKTRLATELQGAAQRTIVQHDDQLLAQQQREGGKVAATLLATDQQRSVLNALDATRPNALAYSPYGHRPQENGLLSLLGFNGERPDPVTGHYPLGNGYRQFNPVLMRFNSPDSWSPFGEGGLNAYTYCLGDPVGRSDPTGHFPITRILFGVMGLVSTAGGVALVAIDEPGTDNTTKNAVGATLIMAGASLLLGVGAYSFKRYDTISRLKQEIAQANAKSVYYRNKAANLARQVAVGEALEAPSFPLQRTLSSRLPYTSHMQRKLSSPLSYTSQIQRRFSSPLPYTSQIQPKFSSPLPHTSKMQRRSSSLPPFTPEARQSLPTLPRTSVSLESTNIRRQTL
jgi:RHS repeat-associated protein